MYKNLFQIPSASPLFHPLFFSHARLLSLHPLIYPSWLFVLQVWLPFLWTSSLCRLHCVHRSLQGLVLRQRKNPQADNPQPTGQSGRKFLFNMCMYYIVLFYCSIVDWYQRGSRGGEAREEKKRRQGSALKRRHLWKGNGKHLGAHLICSMPLSIKTGMHKKIWHSVSL